jgi:phosphoglycerate dehydrogenase-like enzyme
MQILMSASALERVGSRLRDVVSDAQALSLGVDGLVRRDGAPISAAAPEVAWLSRDLHATPLLQTMVEHILRTDSVRWVQTYQAGLDNSFYAAMSARGIQISKSTAQAPAIAEYVLSHALSLLHPIREQAVAQAGREWRRVPFREIGNTHFLIIGYGAIGGEITQRLLSFGAAVTIVRRQEAPAPAPVRTVSMGELNAALGAADVVILACALNEQTRALASAAFFKSMKPGSLFINVARGGLLDEPALRDALDAGVVAHAVLDVFETEPLSAASWLWTHPNVRVTAHCANDGDGVTTRGDLLFLKNLADRLCSVRLDRGGD